MKTLTTIILFLFFISGIISTHAQDVFNESINEDQFYKIVDAIASEKIMQVMDVLDAQEQLEGIQKARLIVMDTVKHLLPFKKFKDMILHKGLALAAVSLAGELVTTVILPPILIYFDLSYLAVLSAGIPSPTYLLPTYFYFQKIKQQKRLSQLLNLSLEEIKEIDKVRREILDYSLEQRILSLSYKNLENNQELTIIKRGFLERMNFPGPKKGLLDLQMLEKIIGEQYPPKILKMMRASSEGNDAIYAMTLMNFIKGNAKATHQLNEYLESAVPSDHSEFIKYNKNLNSMYEHMQMIELDIVDYKKKRSLIEKEKMDSSLNRAAALKKIDLKLKRLARLLNELNLLEYEYVAHIGKINNPNNPSRANFDPDKMWSEFREKFKNEVGYDLDRKIRESESSCAQIILQFL